MSESINISRRGLMLVLSSPSGAGKTTLARQLLVDDDAIAMSVSVTTRAARPGEIDGEDYIFVDKTEYDRRVEANELLEHAQVFEHFYGTPSAAVYGSLEDEMDVLFDIDWQGTQQLQENAPNDLVKVFISSLLRLFQRVDECRVRVNRGFAADLHRSEIQAGHHNGLV